MVHDDEIDSRAFPSWPSDRVFFAHPKDTSLGNDRATTVVAL
jgi:hypothetical protein